MMAEVHIDETFGFYIFTKIYFQLKTVLFMPKKYLFIHISKKKKHKYKVLFFKWIPMGCDQREIDPNGILSVIGRRPMY